MLEELCKKRNIPSVFEKECDWECRRKEIINLLCEEEYGFLPFSHNELSWEAVSADNTFCAGKATLSKVILTAKFDDSSFSFPIYVCMPKKEGKLPFFVHINFRDNVPDKHLPSEEICDRGYAVFSFCYQDVTVDNAKKDINPIDYAEGIADILRKNPTDNTCGKIALWSWAASRVMDYAQTLDCLDMTKSAVIGHSRLGKTALLTGALDERFAYVISNNSGCCGAAISRDKDGEKIEDIMRSFPYWFCNNFKKYVNNEDSMPFDQHFLLSAIAPRKVYVASAKEDEWAGPYSEYLSCYLAGKTYEKLGLKGFECPDRLPVEGDVFNSGSIGYHLRSGTHYLSREDWNKFIDFMEK